MGPQFHQKSKHPAPRHRQDMTSPQPKSRIHRKLITKYKIIKLDGNNKSNTKYAQTPLHDAPILVTNNRHASARTHAYSHTRTHP